HQPLRQGACRWRVDEVAVQAVPRVRWYGDDLALFPVERQGEILLAFDPEIPVEPRLERRSIALEAGGGFPFPQLSIDLRHPALRHVDVGLDLGQGDGGRGEGAVRMGDGVAGVLPALVAKAPRRAAEVLDVAVAIEVTVAVDPYEGTVEDVLELQDRGEIVGPAEVGGGQHEVQGGGVDTAVVGGVGNVVGAGEFPLADLVEYLA